MNGLENWRRFVSRLDIDGMFANEALLLRTLGLYYNDVCSLRGIGKERLTASVVGRTGVYLVTLLRNGNRLSASCTCPSSCNPCKHAGAVLYTLAGASGGPPRITSDVPDTAPGEIRNLTGGGDRMNGILAITGPPNSLGIISAVPIPVVDLEGKPEDVTGVTLRFRYGDTETGGNEDGALLPLDPERAAELAGDLPREWEKSMFFPP